MSYFQKNNESLRMQTVTTRTGIGDVLVFDMFTLVCRTEKDVNTTVTPGREGACPTFTKHTTMTLT